MTEPKDSLVPNALLLLRSNILTRGNIFGATSKAKWAFDLDIPAQGKTLLHAGCGYQFLGGAEATLSALRPLDKRGIAWERSLGLTKLLSRVGVNLGEFYNKVTFRAHLSADPLRCAVEVLRRMDLAFGYLGEQEPCCAVPLYYAGFRGEFARMAQETFESLRNNGVTTLIGMVPSCTYALRDLCPQFVDGWDLEVRYFLEVVLDSMRNGMAFRLPEPTTVTYHDPCVLSRFLHLVEEPREILAGIENLELVEPGHTTGVWSTCCGGGGGFEVVYPDISHLLGTNRVHELLQTGASTIVTSCPGCVLQLRDGVKELEIEDVEVLDMAQLLYRALPED
jgi:hypothetical protein